MFKKHAIISKRCRCCNPMFQVSKLIYECFMIMLMLCKSSYARLTPKVLHRRRPPHRRTRSPAGERAAVERPGRDALGQSTRPLNVQLQSDLTYEEKPIRVLEEMERVTRSKIIKFYKVVWNNHSEQDATWEREDYLREVYPAFFQEW